MWIKALNVLGWLITTAATALWLLCLFFYLNPSPGDFEGLLAFSSVVVVMTIAFPAFAVGVLLVALTSRKESGRAT